MKRVSDLRSQAFGPDGANRIGGFLACLIWTPRFREHYFPLYGIDSVEPGVGASLILFILVSLMTKPNPGQTLEPFFGHR